MTRLEPGGSTGSTLCGQSSPFPSESSALSPRSSVTARRHSGFQPRSPATKHRNSPNAAALSLVAHDLAPLSTAQSADSAHVAAQAAAQSPAQSKDNSRSTFETARRALTQQLQASSTVTDAQRAALQIPIRSEARTAAGVPTSRPVATVDTSQRLAHLIRFLDDQTPIRKAQPRGVLGTQIWVKIADSAPADPSEWSFLALDTSSSYLAQYNGAYAGKPARFALLWRVFRSDGSPKMADRKPSSRGC